jgi:hypothetical protein
MSDPAIREVLPPTMPAGTRVSMYMSGGYLLQDCVLVDDASLTGSGFVHCMFRPGTGPEGEIWLHAEAVLGWAVLPELPAVKPADGG